MKQVRPVAITTPATTADIAAVRSELADIRALIERALSVMPPREWLTTAEAAVAAGFSEVTIRSWCKLFRIGVCVRGEWRVDRGHLRAHIVARYGLGRLAAALHDG